MSLAERVMSRLAGVVVACLVAFGAASAAEHGAFDHAGLARQALEKHIQPGYAALVSAAAALTKSLDAYCARRTNEQQRSMERAFDGLVTAWGRIEHIRFGPITEDNRLERIVETRDAGSAEYTFKGARLLHYSGPALHDARAVDLRMDVNGRVLSATAGSEPMSQEQISEITTRAQLLRSHALTQAAVRDHR